MRSVLPAFLAVHQRLEQVEAALAQATPDEAAALRAHVRALADDGDVFAAAFTGSFFAWVDHDAGEHALLRRLCVDRQLAWHQRQHVHWQLFARWFARPADFTADFEPEHAASWRRLSEEYCSVAPPLAALPRSERDPRAVVVLTQQLIDPHHAPSADVRSYCRTLVDAGWRVLLLNIGELPQVCNLPWYQPMAFLRLDAFDALDHFDCNGVSVPFRQFRPDACVDPAQLGLMAALVAAHRPAAILALGHSFAVADWLSALAPTITFDFGTMLPACRTQAIALARDLTDADEPLRATIGIARERIIALGHYSFALPTATRPTSRAELGIRAGAYALLVAGARLDQEIDTACQELLDQVLERVPEVQLLFAGRFDGHDAIAAARPAWHGRSCYLGFLNDLPSALHCCDGLYNPRRLGGGTSTAYGLAQGAQVLTARFGDGWGTR